MPLSFFRAESDLTLVNIADAGSGTNITKRNRLRNHFSGCDPQSRCGVCYADSSVTTGSPAEHLYWCRSEFVNSPILCSAVSTKWSGATK